MILRLYQNHEETGEKNIKLDGTSLISLNFYMLFFVLYKKCVLQSIYSLFWMSQVMWQVRYDLETSEISR